LPFLDSLEEVEEGAQALIFGAVVVVRHFLSYNTVLPGLANSLMRFGSERYYPSASPAFGT
jgi:hypothetical protein